MNNADLIMGMDDFPYQPWLFVYDVFHVRYTYVSRMLKLHIVKCIHQYFVEELFQLQSGVMPTSEIKFKSSNMPKSCAFRWFIAMLLCACVCVCLCLLTKYLKKCPFNQLHFVRVPSLQGRNDYILSKISLG